MAQLPLGKNAIDWAGTNAQFYSGCATAHYSIHKKQFPKAKPALSKSQNSPYDLGYNETKPFKLNYPEFYL